jgi:hypothetical protein
MCIDWLYAFKSKDEQSMLLSVLSRTMKMTRKVKSVFFVFYRGLCSLLYRHLSWSMAAAAERCSYTTDARRSPGLSLARRTPLPYPLV